MTESKPVRYKKITPEDLWDKKIFQAKSVHGFTSMNDDRYYTVLEDKKRIVMYRYATGSKVRTVFDVSAIGDEKIDTIHTYQFSKDESKLLIAVNFKKLYRHTFFASYYVWDCAAKTCLPLSDKKHQRLAVFSPDASRVAFVWNNNIFIKDLSNGNEEQITRDGRKNRIINGAPDWVYEEEYGLLTGLAWSPDNQYLAFYRFDETHVREFDMSMYPGGYPEIYRYKYPRAGEKNATVTIHLYQVKSGKTSKLKTTVSEDHYIPRIKWTPDGKGICVIRQNRLQNKTEYLLFNPGDGESRCILTETDERYLELDNSLTFLKNSRQFIVRSERNGWWHLYLYAMDGTLVRHLTNGEWNVTSFKGCDEKRGLIYFESTQASPFQRHLYCSTLAGDTPRKLTRAHGMHNTVFNKGFSFFIDYHSNAGSVPTVILYDRTGKKVRELEANTALKTTLKQYRVTEKEFFSFTTPEKIELHGWMIKPPNFSVRKKYPVLFMIYGGPGSQTVTDAWQFGWERLLAQAGYICVSVDNRGTGMRGADFQKCTYGCLGQLETEDQISAARYLASLLFIDQKRIGVFGWSYGGFMACNCILHGADVFASAVAVASVTSYRYYDTVYTERYMNLPQNNPEGYDSHCPLAHADKLKGTFLLVHGTADDNVHFQNSIELVEKLVQAKKQFEMHFLPNKDHGISGGNTTLHLFTRMHTFVLENL